MAHTKKAHKRRKKILLVEDDQDLRELLRDLLITRGYKVYCCCDGQEAIAVFHQQLPDLLLIDRGLPFVDGPGVLKTLNLRASVPDMPVVLMSTEDPAAIRSECLWDYFFRKPLCFEEVPKLISRLLQ